MAAPRQNKGRRTCCIKSRISWSVFTNNLPSFESVESYINRIKLRHFAAVTSFFEIPCYYVWVFSSNDLAERSHHSFRYTLVKIFYATTIELQKLRNLKLLILLFIRQFLLIQLLAFWRWVPWRSIRLVVL